MIKCLNCGHFFTGHFCNQCGQKAEVERLSAAVLLKETLHFFTHLEKGFIRTTYQFLVRPGSTGYQYLLGHRKQYQPPVSYLLIWTGLYLLLHNFIIHYYDYHIEATASVITPAEQANLLLRTHFTPFIFVILLFSTLVIYVLLVYPHFNYVETFALSIYGAGTYFMLLFFSDLFLGMLLQKNVISPPVFLWQTILSSCYNLWFTYDFFKRIPVRFLLARIVVASVIITAIGLLTMNYLPLWWLQLTHT